MTPYYERDGIVIFCGDCLEMMPQLKEPFDAVITDPPYFKVADAAWDNQWETPQEFLDWLDSLLTESEQLLAFNGSLFLFCYWTMAASIELAVRKRFNVLNNIIWRKSNGNAAFRNNKDNLRAFIPTTERIIFAEHYGADTAAKGESGWGIKCDELRGFVFESLRTYLASEWKRAGLKFERANEACGTASMAARHFFSRSQWCLPTREHYEALRRYANRDTPGEYLRREYEDLRREYEDLRRYFSTSVQEQFSDVWDFETAHNEGNYHPAQKPLALMMHIIRTSVRLRGILIDPFMGSGTTLVAAQRLGRRAVGIEISEAYCQVAVERLRQRSLWLVAAPSPKPKQNKMEL